MFELVCPDCGDHLDLEYSEVPSRLQWLRGPRSLRAGLAAFHKHLGLGWPTEKSHRAFDEMPALSGAGQGLAS